jgi:hypothetical protein
MTLTSPSLTRDLGRLQNVFQKLAVPDHALRDQAVSVRDEISLEWCRRAEQSEWFDWPSTAVARGPTSGRLSGSDWRPQGMLSLLGYHVGETLPLHPSIRERILEYAFEHHLPPVGDVAYFREWGEPQSAHRLQKLANTLAALARNAKRRDTAILARAINEWEQDLIYLYEQYYVRLFHFGWPVTEPSGGQFDSRSYRICRPAISAPEFAARKYIEKMLRRSQAG